MNKKEELVKYLVDNYLKDRVLYLRGLLDFSDYDIDVDISELKTNGNLIQHNQTVSLDLYQDEQKVGGTLFQDHQKVERNLIQSNQKVKENLLQHNQKVGGTLFQDNQNVGGDLYQDEKKRMTKEEIERELGYKIIIEEGQNE